MAKSKTAMAYLRVSGRGQVAGNGFDRQLETIQRFCKAEGYELVQVFKEQVSGTTEESGRPEFSAMVTAILANGCNTIIIESMDRLAREYRIQEQLLIYLASKGIGLISANTGEDVAEAIAADPMKKAMIQIQGIFAELDKSLTVKKLRKARQKVKARTGKCEGRKGYRDGSADARAVVDEIKRLRRKPRGGKRKTYEEIADTLNEQGRLTMDGKAFTGKNVAAILYRHKGR
jgi:DNA invertase Pin-like site-specific DNA recombinase